MRNLLNDMRYALRQFGRSPVFTTAAVLTLALGIGGTTAIFTLIHAVMLRSLPVTDPASLYRIGDGDSCCVQGGPQDEWGLFSFPLFERLKAETPEFDQLAAFQAGSGRLSVRRQGVDAAARPLRSEFVTGNYFVTLGVGAFGGRVFTADDDVPSAAPVTVLSHHVWQTVYGGDPSVVGATFVIEGHPFAVVGVAPPGFFGETLRGNPPDLYIPLHQEPLIAGGGSLLRQPVSAWLRAIGRLRPGASVEGIAPRLTGVLRQWIQHDSGYPAMWMPDVIRMLPRQTITLVPAGAGVGVMKEAYGRTLRRAFDTWQWPETWGWDYPHVAMTAARLGEPELAVDALLMDTPKNRYLPNGHNYQRPGLTIYLPGNGGLLAATATMATASGFPRSWAPRWEKLRGLP